MEAKEPEQEREPFEPGGRKHQLPDKMSSEALAAAYADGVRFRSHGITSWTDESIERWMRDVRAELRKRGQLDLIKEQLPIYIDPTRNPPVFGPGAEMVSHADIEHAIHRTSHAPATPLRQIAAG